MCGVASKWRSGVLGGLGFHLLVSPARDELAVVLQTELQLAG